MQATAFDLEAPHGSERAVIRRMSSEVEMVELRWGLKPQTELDRPRRFIRAEGRRFPTQRCLIPASEFHIRRGECGYRVTLEEGNWFYLAGIWHRAEPGWPEAFAVLTVAANEEVSRYQTRQAAVIRRNRHLGWLDGLVPDAELLRRLPARSFTIEPIRVDERQPLFAL